MLEAVMGASVLVALPLVSRGTWHPAKDVGGRLHLGFRVLGLGSGVQGSGFKA